MFECIDALPGLVAFQQGDRLPYLAGHDEDLLGVLVARLAGNRGLHARSPVNEFGIVAADTFAVTTVAEFEPLAGGLQLRELPVPRLLVAELQPTIPARLQKLFDRPGCEERLAPVGADASLTDGLQ
jgi:hypothetical protein